MYTFIKDVINSYKKRRNEDRLNNWLLLQSKNTQKEYQEYKNVRFKGFHTVKWKEDYTGYVLYDGKFYKFYNKDYKELLNLPYLKKGLNLIAIGTPDGDIIRL